MFDCGPLTLYIFLTGLLQTIIVGIVPITAITLAKQMKLVKRYADEAK